MQAEPAPGQLSLGSLGEHTSGTAVCSGSSGPGLGPESGRKVPHNLAGGPWPSRALRGPGPSPRGLAGGLLPGETGMSLTWASGALPAGPGPGSAGSDGTTCSCHRPRSGPGSLHTPGSPAWASGGPAQVTGLHPSHGGAGTPRPSVGPALVGGAVPELREGAPQRSDCHSTESLEAPLPASPGTCRGQLCSWALGPGLSPCLSPSPPSLSADAVRSG